MREWRAFESLKVEGNGVHTPIVPGSYCKVQQKLRDFKTAVRSVKLSILLRVI